MKINKSFNILVFFLIFSLNLQKIDSYVAVNLKAIENNVVTKTAIISALVGSIFAAKNSDGIQKFTEVLREIFVDNFYTVKKGHLYRSNQPKRLKHYILQHGIKVVINLRGKSDAEWYKKEAAICKEMGVELIDIEFSACRLPKKESVIKLIETYKKYQNVPILIHCRAGADRTGLAAALYLMVICGMSKAEAKTQLTKKPIAFWRGHYSFATPNMDKFLNLWAGEKWLYGVYNDKELKSDLGILQKLNLQNETL